MGMGAYTGNNDAVVTGVQCSPCDVAGKKTKSNAQDRQDDHGDGHSQDGSLISRHNREWRELCWWWKSVHCVCNNLEVGSHTYTRSLR